MSAVQFALSQPVGSLPAKEETVLLSDQEALAKVVEGYFGGADAEVGLLIKSLEGGRVCRLGDLQLCERERVLEPGEILTLETPRERGRKVFVDCKGPDPSITVTYKDFSVRERLNGLVSRRFRLTVLNRGGSAVTVRVHLEGQGLASVAES